MLCPECGATVVSSAKFCSLCGAKVSHADSLGSRDQVWPTTEEAVLRHAEVRSTRTDDTRGTEEPRAAFAQEKAEPASQNLGTRRKGQPLVLQGTVSGLDQKTEAPSGTSPATETIWTFRIQPFDPDSDRRTTVSVGLRGKSVLGVLADGDEVAFKGVLPSRGIEWVDYVENLTTGGLVIAGETNQKFLTRPIDASPYSLNASLPSVQGVISGLHKRSEVLSAGPKSGTFKVAVWSFRVLYKDSRSERMIVVPVEMRSKNEIKGLLRDGDMVRIDSTWSSGSTLYPKTLINQETGEKVQSSSNPYVQFEFGQISAGIAFLLFALFGFSKVGGGGQTVGVVLFLIAIGITALIIRVVLRLISSR